jgi:hypothetical protein
MHTRPSSSKVPACSRNASQQQQHRQPKLQLPAQSVRRQRQPRRRRQRCQTDVVVAASSHNGAVSSGNGAVLTAAIPQEAARPQVGLGELAAIPPVLMQWLLRLAHIMCELAAPRVTLRSGFGFLIHMLTRAICRALCKLVALGCAGAKPRACIVMLRWSKAQWVSTCGRCPNAQHRIHTIDKQVRCLLCIGVMMVWQQANAGHACLRLRLTRA